MATVDQAKHGAAVRFGRLDAGLDEVEQAIDASRELLFSQQEPEGYWCGELEADSTLESDYIMVHTLLGTGDEGRMRRAITEILNHQQADGGWNTYTGGPSNLSASVKAYFALKLMGWSANDAPLVKASEWILANGGATEVNTYTKLYLCFFGQYDYNSVPAIPPEIVLFPKWFYFNLYEISSWSRAMLVPLSIAYAKKPFKKIPPEQGIDELFVGGRARANLNLHWDKKIFSWRNFFLVLDKITHWSERVHVRPLRAIALKKAEKWILERVEMSDGLGAIYPGILNTAIALRCLGYSLDDPQVIRTLDEFEKLGIEDAGIPGKMSLPSACSLAARLYGTRRMRCLRWGNPAFPIAIRACCRLPTGCCRKKFATRATGPLKLPMSSQAAGILNSITSSTPTSTILRRCCWLSIR